MARERSGSTFKRAKKLSNGKEQITWWARVTYIDAVTGQRHDRQRRAQSKAHAKELLEDLLKEFDKTDGRSLAHEQKTFKDLADHYEKHYAKKPEYVDGRKVAGLRSLATVQGQLNTLKRVFRQPSRALPNLRRYPHLQSGKAEHSDTQRCRTA